MKFFIKAKSFVSYCFNTQPFLTTFVGTFVPLYGIFIYPDKRLAQQKTQELAEKRIKINSLNEEWSKHYDKWDNYKHDTEISLLEREASLNFLTQLGIETFGEDVLLSGEASQTEPPADNEN